MEDITDNMWKLFPLLMDIALQPGKRGDEGLEYIDPICVAVSNYIQKDKENFIKSEMNELGKMTPLQVLLEQLVSKILNVAISAGSDSNMRKCGFIRDEMGGLRAMSLLMCLLENMNGLIDDHIPSIITVIGQ